MNQLSKIITSFLIKIIFILLLLSSSIGNGQKKSTSVNISSNGKTSISVKNGFGNNFSVEYKGEITLSDDDTDVIAISENGYMEIKKSAFGSRRKIFIEPDNSGRLTKKYYVGGSQKSFDAEGKKWLSEILLEIVRTTTLGAEKRVDRMYKQGGSYKVLKEVGNISSEHVKSRYVKLLLDKDLKEKDIISVLNTVGEDIDSDHHIASILKHNIKHFIISEGATAAYIKTAGKIDSDHHKAEVLKKSIQNGDISDTQMKTLFIIANDIDSDHHKASVLKEVLNRRSLNPENMKLLVNTSKGIDSDHHKASVLKKALNINGLSESVHNSLLASISDMDSDHHIASVFSELLRNKMDSGSLSNLLRLVEDNMDSDNHQASVLKQVATKQNIDSTVLPAYLEALQEISSDHHQADVFKQLSRQEFEDSQLSKILLATKNINSDFHKAETLLSFASEVRNSSSNVKNVYTEACKDISSESHFGRALKAIQ
ncbi:hypothetical protein MTsPCn9_06520 [Croceitalea sp. MTPC9]|uniref:hypothetical protein n=1 Tax=unclassified Croceitalea TaxID=2632280 RepID=UPI002B36BF44|nr:hypothetical protein MTsPCn6_02190 [Croceitalea sp. MTPC6]GMN15716.1 hypothetical protein MTsPCn9_06520 [Croceitalea sp. MTPC9]